MKNFPGYCDVFLKCRKVDAEGPLVRLKNLLFNQETFLTIVQWVTQHWWAVLLMGIAMVIFMAIFIKCCAIHTPSSNPRLPKNLHFTETLRRPVRSLQQKVKNLTFLFFFIKQCVKIQAVFLQECFIMNRKN